MNTECKIPVFCCYEDSRVRFVYRNFASNLQPTYRFALTLHLLWFVVRRLDLFVRHREASLIESSVSI